MEKAANEKSPAKIEAEKPVAKAESTAETDTKKSKKGLITGIIIILLIIAGAISAVIFTSAKNTPENVVLDAVTNTIKDKNHRIYGKLETTVLTPMTLAEGNYKNTVVLEIDGYNEGLSNETTASFTIKNFGGKDYVFRFSEVLQDDGTIYIKSAELSDFINSLASLLSPYLTAEPYSSMVGLLKSLAGKISSTWWRISVPELVAAFGLEDNSIANQYDCLIGAAKKFFDSSSINSITDAYKDSQFLSVEKYDTDEIPSFTNDTYRASIDAVRLAKFWNNVVTIGPVNDMRSCEQGGNNQVSKAFNPVTSDQLESMNGQKIFLDIDKDRRISGIYFTGSTDGNNYTADIHIDKSGGEVSVPENAKPITELKEDISLIIQFVVSIFSSLSSATE